VEKKSVKHDELLYPNNWHEAQGLRCSGQTTNPFSANVIMCFIRAHLKYLAGAPQWVLDQKSEKSPLRTDLQ